MPVYYISIELSKRIQRGQTPPALLTLPLLMIEWENLQFQQLVANCPLVGYFGGAPVLRSVGYCVVSHHFLLHFANNKQVCGCRLLCPTRLCCGIQQDSLQPTFCCNYCLWLFLFLCVWIFLLSGCSLFMWVCKKIQKLSWHDDHHLPRIPIGELCQVPPVAMNFKDSPSPHLLLAFELRGWVTWR